MKKSNPKWREWEREVAKEFGLKEVVASGATDNYKGDCKGSRLLVDCKYTERKTYSLTYDMWEKVFHWALNEKRSPMVAVRAELGDFVVMSEPLYYNLTGNNLWDNAKKPQKSVSVGKQKRAMFYRLADGGSRHTIIVVPMDDVRKALVEHEQSK